MDQPDLIPVNPIINPIPGRHKGKAPLIRKMKLRYPELSESQIAKRVNCSPANVHHVLKNFLGDHSEQDLRDYQENQADVWDSIGMRLLKSVTNDKLRKMQAYPAVIAAATAQDKARDIRGLPTGIHMTVMVDLLETVREMNK